VRFLELHLIAYGHFTSRVLDFSARPGALHVIYGPNEAGKSTALRAVTGLLYGIPPLTNDAHLHRMPDLRLGARLAGPGGESVYVTRRKGLKNTLLDRDDKPLDEAVLARLLGGVTEEMFRTMFGLDHESLRRGAEALLEGRGDLGESLFEAGLGGPALHTLRKDLADEAEAIYTQKSRTRPLNEALRVFLEAQKRVRHESTAASAWLEQERALEAATAELAEIERALADKRALAARLERVRRARPLLARRAALVLRRRELGAVVLLDDAAGEARERVERAEVEARAREAKLADELARLEAKLAAIEVPRSLVDLTEDAIEALAGRLGGHRKAAVERPRLAGELAQLEDDARARVRRLGRDVPLAEVERLRVDAATVARVRKLALAPAALEARVEQARRGAAEAERRWGDARARLDALPRPHGDEAEAELARALARVDRRGDAEERAEAAARDVARLEEAASARLAALGLFTGTLAAARELPVVAVETNDRAERHFAALARRDEQLEARASALAAQLTALTRSLDALQRAGAVPTEDDLTRARASREAAYQRLLFVWQTGERATAASATTGALEIATREADAIADRLRREVERVSELARLLADRAAGEAELPRLERERADLAAAIDAARGDWRELWRAAGLEPLPPAEMRGWLARHAALVALIDQVLEAAARRDAATREAAELSEGLRAALSRIGDEPGESGDLSSLAERARRALAGATRAAEQRRALGDAIADAERARAALAEERASADEALAAWESRWAAATRELGLSAGASPEEAIAVLDGLGELFQKVDEAERARRRVAALDLEAAQLTADVARLAAAHAPDLVGRPVDEAAAELARRYRKGTADLAERRAITRELERRGEALAAERARRLEAEAELDALRRAAGAVDLAELHAKERLSAEARRVDAAVEALDDQLLHAGEGESIEALAAEALAQKPEALEAAGEELDEALTALERRKSDVDRTIGRVRAGFDAIKATGASAADAAAETQEALARLRAEVHRYLRARLASALLDREVDRYRERHQGPVLRRTSDLFRALTLGRYAGVAAGYDERDQARLSCVRAAGGEVPIEGLSDGTRDQLYLALRLASLERLAATNDVLPLVVDDVLIHFDDDRARAALAALGELTATTQVLFFSHHRRLVELAREAVPAERLCEIEL
jgi:uncharacterized protein YhaN